MLINHHKKNTTMKKVKMSINEFLQFRQIAEQMRIFFTYGLKDGQATVRADRARLAEIGY
jgi:hypothetical protein